MRAQTLLITLFLFVLSYNLNAQCAGITVSAGMDHGVCFPGGPTTLNGSISGIYENFFWSPPTGLSDPFSMTPTAFVTTPTTYTLTAEAIDPNAPNLIVNGDFEQGNTGFSSVYTNNQSNLINPGTYAVVQSPAIVLSTFPQCDDHTSGVGNMMVVHGLTSSGNNVWCQTVNVQPNTTYEFAAWVMTVVPFFPSSFDFTINGVSLGPMTFPANSICEWAEYAKLWNSGAANTATICIVDQGGGGLINGYALDDISLRALCSETDDVTISVVTIDAIAPTIEFLPCDAGAQGFALDGSASSSGPNITYQWSTSDGNIVSGANSAICYVDQAGSYMLTVTYNDGFSVCTDFAFTQVIDDPNVPLAFASVPSIVDCFNPEIEIDGTGSSEGPEYTYVWTTTDGNIVSGGNTLYPTVDAGGTYDLLVTNTDNGCTAEVSAIVEEDLEIPDAEAAADEDIDCDVTIVEVDGTGSSEGNNFSYEWTTDDGNIVNGEFSLLAEVDATGTYTITVTNDNNGCTNTAEVFVDEDTTPPVPDIDAPAMVDCNSSEVSLDASNSSGSGNLLADWMTDDGLIVSGQNTLTPDVEGAGTYTLTITDEANGCTATDEVTIEENTTPPETNIETPEMLDCNNAEITLDATGSSGQGNLLADWTTNDGNIVNGDDTLEPNVDNEGTYTLVITDEANGCTATEQVTVQGDFEEPTIDIEDPEMLTCSVNTVIIDATNSSNAANFSFSWNTSNGNIVNGGNTLEPEVDQTGNYELTITNNDNGCTSAEAVEISADTTEPTADAGEDEQLNCDLLEIELDASNSSQGGNYEYDWTTDDGNILSGADTLIAEIDASGTYIFQVTNTQNDCIAIDTVEVTLDDDLPTADAGAAEDFTCTTSEIELNGENSSQGGNFKYFWTAVQGNIVSGDTTLTPTIDSAGIYVIEVLDTLNNCISTDTITVGEDFDLPTADAGANLEIPCFSDTLQLNGNNSSQGSNFEYEWTTSDGNIVSGGNDLTAEVNASGTYQIQVTNTANGCTSTADVEVIQASNPGVSIESQMDVDCNGNSTGSATAVGSDGLPGYTYAWSSGGNTATENDLAAGMYEVTVTDANGCQNTTQATVSEPPVLQVDLMGTPETGFGLNDGTASANPMGGVSDYTYEWNTGATTQMITDLAPGDYCVTITDQNGCTTDGCFAVNPFLCGGIFANFESSNVSCAEGNNGSATIVMDGGTAPFIFEWSNGETGDNVSNLLADTYEVTATDDNGCVVIESITITEPDPVAINILNVTDAACAGSATGAASVEAVGGTPNFSYIWSNDSIGASIQNVLAGTYMVTATDENDCSETITIEILGANDTEAPVAITQNISVVLNEDGEVSITPDMIDNGSSDNCELGPMSLDLSNFNCDDIGDVMVTLTVEDVSGNMASETAIVTVIDQTPPILSCPDDIFSNFCTFPIDYPIPTAEDLCGDATVAQVSGLPSGSVFPIGTTEIVFSALDDFGNESTCTFNITVLTDMVADSEISPIACAGDQNGEATVTVDGGTPPFQYQWDDPAMQMTQTATGLTAGFYSVTIIDATGCEIGATIEVTEPDTLTVDTQFTEPDCNGEENATATALPSGGTTPYSYEWNDADMQTTQTADGLPQGMYEVMVTDSNGCVELATVDISEPPALEITLDSIIDELQGMDGAIYITPSGGTNTVYTFEWTYQGDPFSNEEDLENLSSGEYCVTITDENGCTETDCYLLDIIFNTFNPALNNYISISPNPTSGLLHVDLQLPTQSDIKIDFYDVMGRLILEGAKLKVQNGSLVFDLGRFAEGVYLMKFLVDGEYLVKRVVVD